VAQQARNLVMKLGDGETTDHRLFGGAYLLLLIIHQSRPDRSKDDQDKRGLAEPYRLTCDDVARREGLEPPTARSVVCR
jgi:hypothetical protein